MDMDVRPRQAIEAAIVRLLRPLVRVLLRHAGELLPADYHDWALREKERLAEAYLRAMRQLIAHLERSGDLERALQYARRAVSADPLHEEAHRDVMRLLGATVWNRAAAREVCGQNPDPRRRGKTGGDPPGRSRRRDHG